MYTNLNPKTIDNFDNAKNGSTAVKTGSSATFRKIGFEDLTDVVISDNFKLTYVKKAVCDYDGNWYDAVIIGNQVWMANNMMTTHYSDGTSITYSTSIGSTAYYTYTKQTNISTEDYGYLYNMRAISKGTTSSSENPSGIQGIAPQGWHVPSNSEWIQMENYISEKLGGGTLSEQTIYSGYIFTDTSIASVLSSKKYWKESDVGNSPGLYLEQNNSSCFSAFPCGIKTNNSEPIDKQTGAYFATCTKNENYCIVHNITYDNSGINVLTNVSDTKAISVRCVCDMTAEQFLENAITDKTYFENAFEDIDGNSYDAVIIGNQVWSAQNLRTTHYPDGSEMKDVNTIYSSTNPGYAHVNLKPMHDETRGLIYSWNAAMNGEASSSTNPSGVRGICPNGWHIPSVSERNQMLDYVASMPYASFGYIKALTSTEYWKNSTTDKSPGCKPNLNNKTGFNAIPNHNVSHENGYSFRVLCTDYGSYSYDFENGSSLPSQTYTGYGYIMGGIRCLYDGTVDEFKAYMSKRYMNSSALKNESGVWTNGLLCLEDLKEVDFDEKDTNTEQTFFKKALKDVDGNLYDVVVIGDQVWMAEHLRVRNYANGMYYMQKNTASSAARYYACANNSEDYVEQYGLLYNLAAFAMDPIPDDYSKYSPNNVPSGIQGVAPYGWHVPSQAEYVKLVTYLTNNQDKYGPVAKSMASKTGWVSSTVQNAVGNDLSLNNSSGFNLMPAGGGTNIPITAQFNKQCNLATISLSTKTVYDYGYISYNSPSIQGIASLNSYNSANNTIFCSVRCVYDGSAKQFLNEMSKKDKLFVYNGKVWTYGKAKTNIPEPSESDVGKILTVNSLGNLVLGTLPII